MARGRMVNHSISRSLKFNQLPDDTCRLLATWIISHLDKNGVFYGDPVMVRSLIFPRRVDIEVAQVEAYLRVGRYQDVIDLTNANLEVTKNLEESYYYRALARRALGDQAGAREDLQKALQYNPLYDRAAKALDE